MQVIDEMSNTRLMEYVSDNEDSTEVERELADRLRMAIEEIEMLVEDLNALRAANGDGS